MLEHHLVEALKEDLDAERQRLLPPTETFLRQFKGLIDHYSEVYEATRHNPLVEHYGSDSHRSMAGFVFADDLPTTQELFELNPQAFGDAQSDGSRPAIQVTVSMRTQPQIDVIEAETRLCCAGILTDTQQLGVYDATYSYRDQFWESIQLPGARALNYTNNPLDPIGDLVFGSMLQPTFANDDERFASMHAAIDLVSRSEQP